MEEQKRRFEARIEDPLRQWKLSPMDLPSRSKWYEYSRARDMMLAGDRHQMGTVAHPAFRRQERARLNCIQPPPGNRSPSKKVPREKVKLPKRSKKHAYDDQATIKRRKFIAEKY